MGLARPSVRLRVTTAATVLICVGLAVAGVSAVRVLHRSLASDNDAVLIDRVDELELMIADGRLGPVIEATGKETGQLQVVDQAGEVVSASTGLADTSRLDAIDPPPMGHQIAATVDGSRVDGVAGEQFRVVARTVPSARGPLTIYGVTSLRAADRAEGHLENVLLVGLPLLVLLAAALIWWVVGRALAPVDAMRGVVDRIEANDLAERVEVAGTRDEIGRLGATLNRMLGRLEDATRRQRLFAAAASHELRSPISAIRTELEVGLAYPDRTDWQQVATESLTEVDRLERLARDLLELTRLQADGVALGAGPITSRLLEPLDLAALVRAEIAKRPPPAGIEVDATLSTCRIVADRDLVVRLLRNLLDNAERHAVARVSVAVQMVDSTVRLRVWNDGRTIPSEDRERIFDPFTRLDDARVLDEGGAGLGLAIARALAENIGGRLAAVDAPSGATFDATFPATFPAN